MVTATLGGLIKDYRIKKRLSQFDVSLRIGWKDTSRLSKIEQGRVGKPTRETIEKIIKALELNEQETGEFLLAGGYLPTEVEIQMIIKILKPVVDNWKYPAHIMDFSWRIIYGNISFLKIVNLPLNVGRAIEKKRLNALTFAFQFNNPNIVVEKGEDINTLKPLQMAQVAAFKIENFRYKNELWHKKLIKDLIKNADFKRLWLKTNPKIYRKVLLDYEYLRITKFNTSHKQTLSFHLQTSRVINDPRFQATLYYPTDTHTEVYCLKLKKAKN